MLVAGGASKIVWRLNARYALLGLFSTPLLILAIGIAIGTPDATSIASAVGMVGATLLLVYVGFVHGALMIGPDGLRRIGVFGGDYWPWSAFARFYKDEMYPAVILFVRATRPGHNPIVEQVTGDQGRTEMLGYNYLMSVDALVDRLNEQIRLGSS